MKRIPLKGMTLAAVWLLLSGAGPSVSADADAPFSMLEAVNREFTRVVRQATPGVVFIQVEKTFESGRPGPPGFNNPFDLFGDEFFERFFGPRFQPPSRPRRYTQRGQGSGFLITEDGYILTNNHVVGDADKITVRLHDGREFEGIRVGTDPKSEVAVIKIDAPEERLPYLEIGDSEALEIGEWVLAIGNPFGLTETVTTGVVSAKGRSGMGIADYENFIQTDAAINPGNSGGPLLNVQGKVVGINTAIFSRTGGSMGIGFAVPINMAIAIKDQLISSGRVVRGFLGILIQPVTADLADSFGLERAQGILVSEVQSGTPAEDGGLRNGDIILRLNGEDVPGVPEFRNRIAASAPESTVVLTVFRDGEQVELSLRIGTLPEEEETARVETDLLGKLGLSVQDITPEIAARSGYAADSGVLISAVEEGSPAANAGLQTGHLITSVNRRPVKDVEDFQRALRDAEKDKAVLLRVQHGRAFRFVVLRFE